MGLWCCTSSGADAGLVTGLFPPQERDWGLPSEAELSPRAAARVGREAATQTFDPGARAINIDWSTNLDGKQIERWSEALGQSLVDRRRQELEAFERHGELPPCKENEHELLVIGMDGGRVQTREKSEETGSRWKEDKVLTISSCLKGDGSEAHPPKKLLTTTLATMQDSRMFGRLARLEAERRGIRNAREVILIGDGGNWIDPICEEHFACHQRIIDYYHAAEHLHEVAKAARPSNDKAAAKLAEQLVGLLWNGRIEALLRRLDKLSDEAGPPRPGDPENHPRQVLAENAGYFQRHRQHMDYPAYRSRGWPIGSGIIESGVKRFGKRVKGTEQFWSIEGVEAILALRSKWLSEDEESQHYWLGLPPRKLAA
jgi:hypothetical protein